MWDGHHHNLDVFVEDQFPDFIKYHLNGKGDAPWGTLKPVLHRFTQPDLGDPHDHPWGFWSFVLQGSYVEEVFVQSPEGVWIRHKQLHRMGDALQVRATHIHRIVELPDGECITCTLYGPWERDFRFYPIEELTNAT